MFFSFSSGSLALRIDDESLLSDSASAHVRQVEQLIGAGKHDGAKSNMCHANSEPKLQGVRCRVALATQGPAAMAPSYEWDKVLIQYCGSLVDDFPAFDCFCCLLAVRCPRWHNLAGFSYISLFHQQEHQTLHQSSSC